ncbi:MAG TPA: carboxypeptidase regulatory-like domain-containing protein [Jatrophihabitantaceae bacterium]
MTKLRWTTGRATRQIALGVVGAVTLALSVAVTPAAASPAPPGGPTAKVPSTAPAGKAAPAAGQAAPNGSQPNYQPAPCNVAQKKVGGKAFAQCFAMIHTALAGTVTADAAGPPPTALGPAQIQDAYSLPATGAGQTVGIVDAFGDSTAEADLGVFRAQFGLPPCTTDNGCFQKVDQRGGTNYPPDDAGWAGETSLDLDAVSAACPACHILLVEGDDNALDNLAIGVDTAVSLGAKFVSNSYGIAGETPDETLLDQHYDHPGVAVTASTGDIGNVTNWPATSPTVVGVGGTTLTQDSSPRGWHEAAWAGGGSGCSPFEPHPDYQNGIATNCPNNRANSDISADADPNTGLAVFDSIPFLGQSGWLQIGGTSLSSPLVAAMYALAGTPISGTDPVTYPYQAPATSLNDVTSGINGGCGNVLCQAGPGWDGPTGLGTPNGVSALTTGPHGNITGTVTDAATGKGLADATLTTAEGFRTTTDSSGHYLITIPVGTYTATYSRFGYASDTETNVAVTDGGTTTENVALHTTPAVTLSGTIADGSGHGWPLYTRISVAGDPDGPFFTDPITGHYSIQVPADASYDVTFTAQLPGYETVEQSVAVGSGSTTHDVPVPVSPDCVAPGYSTGSPCVKVTGGLVEGNVADLDTGNAINGATVTSVDQPVQKGTTAATPDDPANPDGFYWLFSSLTGSHPFAASHLQHAAKTQPVAVTADEPTRADFQLAAGKLTVNATSITKSQALGASTTTTLHFANTGSGAAQVNLAERRGSFEILRADGTRLDQNRIQSSAGAEVRRLDVPVSDRSLAAAGAKAGGARPSSVLPTGPWQAISDYPNAVMDNIADVWAGELYSVTGIDAATETGPHLRNELARFDPASGQWTQLTPIPTPRERPAGAIIDGKFYVVGGWDDEGFPIRTLDIYDIASNTWTTGAPIPTAWAASASAVADGKLYLVGGCDANHCGTQDVWVYDPASNAWSQAKDYPEQSSWSQCGDIAGRIYCAGTSSEDDAHAFAYDPRNDDWTPVASPPQQVWGAGYVAADGELLISGGVVNGEISNEGFAYDPESDTWSDLPASNNTVYRGAAACGLYRIGGAVGGFDVVASAELLPGFDDCAEQTDVPWLDESPAGFTLAPGASQDVVVTLNAADVTQPGAYTAAIAVTSNTSTRIGPMNVTLNVTPPKDWGTVAGTVSGTDCQHNALRPQGVAIQTDGTSFSTTMSTPAQDTYAFWASKKVNPLTITVNSPGWISQTAKKVKINQGKTTTVNFNLQVDCRTQRLSVRSDGTEGNTFSQSPSISRDGRYVAFESFASNLVPGDTNGAHDVFVSDRVAGTTERVSVAGDGSEGNDFSGSPSISADGRYVAFESFASNLVPGDTNGVEDVFVRDRIAGTTERVSVAGDGTPGDGNSLQPSITPDGRYVAFESLASNLVPGDTNSIKDVFVRDRVTGTTERVSVASDGTQGNQFAESASISADGRYVSFDTDASNLVSGDTNGTVDVLVHDRVTGTTERVSVASDGTQGNQTSAEPSVSADGRYVAYESLASNLVPGDTTGTWDVFVRDRAAGTTTRVSVAADGTASNPGFSEQPSISPDGRYVAFMSAASNLVPGDTNETEDVFVHDRVAGTNERVSVASDGTQGDLDSGNPAISADGRYVAFESDASNLVPVPGDTNFDADVFVRDRGR